ncbi:symplekin tight junction carboxy-terminal protein [Cystoisospora suis]|uniref:Symplekin tight junction carboxy-terminal protein n=1 Tax=Cystoisospora suis TaxID=483139 RepID=A0A2C6KI84_9APIC|nr:symplekin tight junction carboxy-terminal protein [Cystoisospora suis]
MLPRPSEASQGRPESLPVGMADVTSNPAKKVRHDSPSHGLPGDGAQQTRQSTTLCPSARTASNARSSQAPSGSVSLSFPHSPTGLPRGSTEGIDSCFTSHGKLELSEELFDELSRVTDQTPHSTIYNILKRLQTAASEFFRIVRDKQRHEYVLADLRDADSDQGRDTTRGERGGNSSKPNKRKEDSVSASDVSAGKEHSNAKERLQAYIQHFLPRFLKLGTHPVPIVRHFFLQFVARLMHMDGRGVPACLISVNECMSSSKGKNLPDLENVFSQALDVLRRLWKTILCYSSLSAARLRRYGSLGVQDFFGGEEQVTQGFKALISIRCMIHDHLLSFSSRSSSLPPSSLSSSLSKVEAEALESYRRSLAIIERSLEFLCVKPSSASTVSTSAYGRIFPFSILPPTTPCDSHRPPPPSSSSPSLSNFDPDFLSFAPSSHDRQSSTVSSSVATASPASFFGGPSPESNPGLVMEGSTRAGLSAENLAPSSSLPPSLPVSPPTTQEVSPTMDSQAIQYIQDCSVEVLGDSLLMQTLEKWSFDDGDLLIRLLTQTPPVCIIPSSMSAAEGEKNKSIGGGEAKEVAGKETGPADKKDQQVQGSSEESKGVQMPTEGGSAMSSSPAKIENSFSCVLDPVRYAFVNQTIAWLASRRPHYLSIFYPSLKYLVSWLTKDPSAPSPLPPPPPLPPSDSPCPVVPSFSPFSQAFLRLALPAKEGLLSVVLMEFMRLLASPLCTNNLWSGKILEILHLGGRAGSLQSLSKEAQSMFGAMWIPRSQPIKGSASSNRTSDSFVFVFPSEDTNTLVKGGEQEGMQNTLGRTESFDGGMGSCGVYPGDPAAGAAGGGGGASEETSVHHHSASFPIPSLPGSASSLEELAKDSLKQPPMGRSRGEEERPGGGLEKSAADQNPPAAETSVDASEKSLGQANAVSSPRHEGSEGVFSIDRGSKEAGLTVGAKKALEETAKDIMKTEEEGLLQQVGLWKRSDDGLFELQEHQRLDALSWLASTHGDNDIAELAMHALMNTRHSGGAERTSSGKERRELLARRKRLLEAEEEQERGLDGDVNSSQRKECSQESAKEKVVDERKLVCATMQDVSRRFTEEKEAGRRLWNEEEIDFLGKDTSKKAVGLPQLFEDDSLETLATYFRSLSSMEVRLSRLPEKNVEESGGRDKPISRKHLSCSLRRVSSFLPGSASSSADGDIADLIRMPDVRTLQRHAGLFKKLIFGQILRNRFLPQIVGSNMFASSLRYHQKRTEVAVRLIFWPTQSPEMQRDLCISFLHALFRYRILPPLDEREGGEGDHHSASSLSDKREEELLEWRIRLSTLLDLLFFKASRDLEASSCYSSCLSYPTSKSASSDPSVLTVDESDRHFFTSESSKNVGQRQLQGSIPSRSVEQGSSLPSSHHGMGPAGGGGRKGTFPRDDLVPLSKVGLVADVFASKPQRKRRPYCFMTKKDSNTTSSVDSTSLSSSTIPMSSIAQKGGEAAALSSWEYAARAVKVFEGRLPESILGWTFLLPGDPPSFIEKSTSRRTKKEEERLPHLSGQEDQSLSQRSTSFPHGGEKHDDATGTLVQQDPSATAVAEGTKSLRDLSPCIGGEVAEEEQKRRRQEVDNNVRHSVEGMTRDTNGRNDSAAAACKEESHTHPHTSSVMISKKENSMVTGQRGMEREEMRSIPENKWKYSDVFELCLEAAICKDTLADNALRDAYCQLLGRFFVELPHVTASGFQRMAGWAVGLQGVFYRRLSVALLSQLIKRGHDFLARRTAFSLVLSLQHAPDSEAVRRLFLKLFSSPKGLYVLPKNDAGTTELSPDWQEPRLRVLSLNKGSSTSSSPSFRCIQHAHKGDVSIGASSSSSSSDSSPSSSPPSHSDPPLIKKERDAESQVDVTMEIQVTTSERKNDTKETEEIHDYGLEVDEEERRGWRDPNQFGRRWIEACAGILLRSLALEGSKFAAPIDANAFIVALAQRILERSEEARGRRSEAAGDTGEREVVQERAGCYLTLAARHPHLLHAFLEVFLLASPERKQPLEDLFAKCIAQISAPTCHLEYLRMLEYYEAGQERLVSIVLENCVTTVYEHPSQDPRFLFDLVDALWRLLKQAKDGEGALPSGEADQKKRSLERLAISFVPFFNRDQLETYLPIMTFGDHDEVSLKRALTRLLIMPRELREARPHHVYTPPDVLLSLFYHLPCSTGEQRKKQTTILDYCLDLTGCTPKSTSPSEIFPLDAIATTCHRIVDDESQPVSVVFGRLLCQIAQTMPSLREFLAGTIMQSLVRRKVWTSKSLWKGFVMATSILWAEQKDLLFKIFLVLPEEQARDILQRLQQRHSVTADLSTFLYQDEQARRSCPHYLRVLLGITN